jgi:hypothetical protein
MPPAKKQVTIKVSDDDSDGGQSDVESVASAKSKLSAKSKQAKSKLSAKSKQAAKSAKTTPNFSLALSAERTYTDEERNEILQNRVMVPKPYWRLIPEDSDVCYITTDGNFMRGGTVLINQSINGKVFISMKYNGHEKRVNVEFVETIYKKIPPANYIETLIMRDQINHLNELFGTTKKLIEAMLKGGK